jgi:hypothetical protein
MIIKNDTLIVSESEFDSPKKFNELVLETVNKIISSKTKKFLSKKSNRQILLEKYGKKAFLIPDELKFPVMNEKGKYDCGLIYAARIRSKQYAGKRPGYLEIAKKAGELYRKNKCERKLKIHINEWEEGNNDLDFVDFVETISHNVFFEIENFDQIKVE